MNTTISNDATATIGSPRRGPVARVGQKEDARRILERKARLLQSLEPDPIRYEWFVGYLRGLRGLRCATGNEKQNSPAEHKLYLAAAESDDPGCAALGCGYITGLHLGQPFPT